MNQEEVKQFVDRMIDAGHTNSQAAEKAGVSRNYVAARKLRRKNADGRKALAALAALRTLARAMPNAPVAEALAAVEEKADV